MLQHFGPDIWLCDGQTVSTLGFHYGTRMVVIRQGSGALILWSPVAMTDDIRREVEKLGDVRHVIAPNTLHHLWAGDWLARYPQARLYGVPGLDAKRKDLDIDTVLGDTPPASWAEDLDQVIFRGNKIATEAVFFHKPSRTAIFTDLLQQFPKGWHKGWRAWVAKLDLMVEPEPTVPRKFRMAFSDKDAARKAVEKIRTWRAENVLMAHGAPVRGGGAALIDRAFSWLG